MSPSIVAFEEYGRYGEFKQDSFPVQHIAGPKRVRGETGRKRNNIKPWRLMRLSSRKQGKETIEKDSEPYP